MSEVSDDRPGEGDAPTRVQLPSSTHNALPTIASPPDYAAIAHAALEQVEQLSTQIEAKVPMCRQAWCRYGEALFAQRKLMPSDRVFGTWVKANALDVGR